MKTMKALVKSHPKKGLWMEEVAIPEPSDDEVLIRTIKTGICGTDIHIYEWDAWSQRTVKTPMIIGHEFVGEVVAVGSCVKDVRIGDRVSGEGHIVCGRCRACRQGKKHCCFQTRGFGYHISGCFAEYFPFPAENIYPIPPSISDASAAIFDPLGNAAHTALSYDLVGEDVLITGAGPIGMMAAAICRYAGARHVVVTDLNPYRLSLAKTMGATAVVNVREESLANARMRLGIGDGFTVGLEMSGNPLGFNDMLEAMQSGGKIALLGILPPNTAINWDLVIFKLLNIKGIWGREIFGTWDKLIHMIEGGLTVSPVITHEFPVQIFQEAFDTMLSGQSGKIILDWEKM